MDTVFKIVAGVMVSLILLVVLERGEKHIATLLALAICCMAVVLSAEFLQPIIQLIKQLQRTAEMDSFLLSQLIKSVATATICEVTATLCAESGYASLGKTLQYVGTSVILYLSIPLMTELMEMITDLLGGA